MRGIAEKTEELQTELLKRKIDIAIITETQKKNKESEDIGNYIMIYCGVPANQWASSGVATAIRKDWKHKIQDYTLISDRIIGTRIKVVIRNFHRCTVHIASIHIYFSNTCTCDSHNISVNTLIVKPDKTLKLLLLALQHVSVFHKATLRELFVPIKVTYCPLLFSKYAGSTSYCIVFVVDGLGFHVTRFPCVDFFCPCMSCVI